MKNSLAHAANEGNTQAARQDCGMGGWQALPARAIPTTPVGGKMGGVKRGQIFCQQNGIGWQSSQLPGQGETVEMGQQPLPHISDIHRAAGKIVIAQVLEHLHQLGHGLLGGCGRTAPLLDSLSHGVGERPGR